MTLDMEQDKKIEEIRAWHIAALHNIIRTQSEYITKLERDLRLGQKLFEGRTPRG